MPVLPASDGNDYNFPDGTTSEVAQKFLQAKGLTIRGAGQAATPGAMSFTGSDQSPDVLAQKRAAGAKSLIEGKAAAERTMVEGAATAVTMGIGGVGAVAAETLGTRLLASGFGTKMTQFLVKPLLRVAGAYGGGVAGSAVSSAGSAALGLEGAPKTFKEAASHAVEAGAGQAALQGAFETAVPLAQKTLGAIWDGIEKAALQSKTATNTKKLEGLKIQMADELKKANILDIRDAHAQEIQKVTGEIVNDMGQMRAPEQMADLGKTIETRVNAKLQQRMEPIYQELDKAATDSGVTVNARDIGQKILDIASAEPRGVGVAKPFTKPSSRFSEIVRAAASGQKQTETVGMVDKLGKTAVQEVPAGTKVEGDDLTEAFRILTDQGQNSKVGLDAMMKARGTISREIANPATDDETKGLLQQILKPVDNTIKDGLAQINPGLAVKWDTAQDLWHKGKIIQDKVVMERLRNAGARSLTSEIQPNAPRNVEQMRLLFNEAFPKDAADSMWKDLQRAKVEELMGTDLADFGNKYRQYGNTMNRLFQTPAEKDTANRLVTMSDDFAQLTRKPSIKNDQKLEAIQNAISMLEGGASQKAIAARMGEFITRPHMAMYGTAAMLGGHAYGPAGIAGGMAAMAGAEAVGQKAIPAIVRAAEHPYEANQLISSLKSFIKDGNPNTSANLARALYASYKVGGAAQEMMASHAQTQP